MLLLLLTERSPISFSQLHLDKPFGFRQFHQCSRLHGSNILTDIVSIDGCLEVSHGGVEILVAAGVSSEPFACDAGLISTAIRQTPETRVTLEEGSGVQ